MAFFTCGLMVEAARKVCKYAHNYKSDKRGKISVGRVTIDFCFAYDWPRNKGNNFSDWMVHLLRTI